MLPNTSAKFYPCLVLLIVSKNIIQMAVGSSWIRGACHLWFRCKEAFPNDWSCLRYFIFYLFRMLYHPLYTKVEIKVRPQLNFGLTAADGTKLKHRVDLKLDRCTLCHDIGVTLKYVHVPNIICSLQSTD